ncbi:MAG: ribosome-associated translation inhibitor RaiA [Candidatus Poribacteria bacterium]|nr:ribosome-associated translation inhibitor RaiA [Candidatus Poribacteria bacterium]
MKVTYSGHNLKITDDIHAYILKRADKIESRFDGMQELNVVLKSEKHRFDAEMIVTAPRVSFYAKSETHEILSALDSVTDKIVSQIRRYRDRVKDRRHNAPHREVVERLNSNMEETLPEVDTDDAPVVVSTQDKFASKPLTVAEATMELQASNAEFLLFLNAETRQVNLLYEMEKERYGWVEPLFA